MSTTTATRKATARPAAKKALAKAAPALAQGTQATQAVLTITSKNYSSWSLRGWLMARFAGLAFTENVLPPDDPTNRADLLLLSSSIRVPDLRVGDVHVWDTLAIAEYLHECFPEAKLLPADAKARAHCRAISGEMHSGFASLRSALPMNVPAASDRA